LERSVPNLCGLITTTRGVIAVIGDLSHSEIRFIEAATDQLVGAVPMTPGEPFPAVFDVSFDHSVTAVASEAETNKPGAAIEVWDLAAGQRRIRLVPGLGLIRHLEFSRDARFLSCTAENGVVAYETSQFKPVMTYHGYLSARATWAADGTTLAVPLSQENGVR